VAKCPNCSGENADTQRFCGECGTPLPAAGPPTQSSPGNGETARLPTVDLASGMVFAKRYQVIEELGTGGMGRVFRVLDKKLDEEIALKLVRPEIASDRATIERFAAELKLARQIVHKNVARMFDLYEEGGVPFITMEYVPGENLKRLIRKVGRLDPWQAIPVARGICDGLAEAHRHGIVHRDLKPQNVMIDEEGQAKIMDFGLARLLKTDDKTRKEGTEGTPAYISPEQARGLAADGRADIYSLGVLMYEMLTGSVPFKGATAAEVVQKHLTERPRDLRELNPGISPGLSGVVTRCLEKDPAARFATAAEVRQALDGLPAPRRGAGAEEGPRPVSIGRRIATTAALAAVVALAGYLVYTLTSGPAEPPAVSAIAVLPVSDISPTPSRSDLGRPIQEAIATGLTGDARLTVVPQLTVDSIDTKGKNTKEVARRLKADYLLQLTLRDEPPAVQLKAVLINAAHDRPARTYELSREGGLTASVKEEFVKDLAMVLPWDVAEDRQGKSAKGVSSDLDARALYHQGMTLIDEVYLPKRTEEVFASAIGKYDKALALDPDYALALWALGNAYESRYNNTPRRERDPRDLDKLYGYYLRAYAMNPDSAETNVGLGWAHFNKGEFPRAYDFFKNALRLEPRSAVVNLDAGAFLRSIGLFAEARRYLERAAELAPHDPDPPILISQCLMSLGRFGEAADISGRVVGKAPANIGFRHIHALHLALAGRLTESAREVSAIRGMDPKYMYLPMTEAVLAAARGEKDKALALKGETVSLHIPGTCFYILLGMKEEAVANIEAGIARGFEDTGEYLYSYPSLVNNPGFDTLRSLPRFQEVQKKQKEAYLRDLKKFEKL
jgi:serine/threonine protein kinase/tetratricopeptide (TPR) repeat protein